jgi:hypothetical protein
MKRFRASVDNRPLDLKSIIECGAGIKFICKHLDGNRLNQSRRFKMDIYPDVTMEKDEKPFVYDDNVTVFVTPEQYELLITTHQKVLEVRLEEMEEFGFKTNTGIHVYYACLHSNFTVKDGYSEWDVKFC